MQQTPNRWAFVLTPSHLLTPYPPGVLPLCSKDSRIGVTSALCLDLCSFSLPTGKALSQKTHLIRVFPQKHFCQLCRNTTQCNTTQCKSFPSTWFLWWEGPLEISYVHYDSGLIFSRQIAGRLRSCFSTHLVPVDWQFPCFSVSSHLRGAVSQTDDAFTKPQVVFKCAACWRHWTLISKPALFTVTCHLTCLTFQTVVG